jgi:hypothetical protein
MIDGTDTSYAVPDFHMAIGVPGHGGDTVTRFDTGRYQCFGYLSSTTVQTPIMATPNRTFNGVCNNFLLGVLTGCMIQDTRDNQRPILH